MREAASSASRAAASDRGHVEDHVAIELRRELDDRPELLRAGVLDQRAIGRGQERRAGFRGRDQAAEKRFVEAVRVLQRIDDREARLRAEQQRRVAVGQVQIGEERLRRRHFRQRGGHVHGRRGRADATLGADEREHLAGRRRRGAMRDEARDRLLERRRGDRLVQEFGRAGPHRLEQDRRVRLGGHDEEPCRRMLALHRRHRRRDGARAARVHDDDVRRLGRRVHQRGQLGRAPARRAHAARAQELLQLAIERIDDENFRNQTCSHLCIAHRTNSTFRRNEAESSTRQVVPLRPRRDRDEPADDILVIRPVRRPPMPSRKKPMMFAMVTLLLPFGQPAKKRVDVEQRPPATMRGLRA